MSLFVRFSRSQSGIRWPEECFQLLAATVADVRAWREFMDVELDQAPKTLNHRISELSGFFEFAREAAAAGKLPLLIHNPAHKDFIRRPSTEPVDETAALSARNARKLMEIPNGDDPILAYRDRAILKFYLFTGARIRTGCLLDVADFRFDEEDPKIRVQEKGHGKSKRTIGFTSKPRKRSGDISPRPNSKAGRSFALVRTLARRDSAADALV